jgi:hypothetical protein
MADTCATNVGLIYDNENIGDSLGKINNNFTTLKQAACDLENKLENIVNVRTFFYYGPNSATDSEDGVNAGNLTLPSSTTIQNFVNKPEALNLPSFSEVGDVAYVVYQKTGWYTNSNVYSRSGSGTVPYTVAKQEARQYQRTRSIGRTRRIGIGWVTRSVTETITYWVTVYFTYYAGYSWSTTVSDTYNTYSPIFVIYKLTFNGNNYAIDAGFPKFTRASTNSTLNWNNPATWSIY